MAINSSPAVQPPDEPALEEALRQLEALYEIEQRRRSVADTKLGNLQNTIDIIVTLVSGAFVVAIMQERTGVPNAWQLLAYLALFVALGFFVWAAQQMTKANDPKPFHARTPNGIVNVLQQKTTKRALLEEAVADYSKLIDKNHDAIDGRLTLYRAAIENIIKGVYSLATIPIIFVAALLCASSAGHGNAPNPPPSSSPSAPPTVK